MIPLALLFSQLVWRLSGLGDWAAAESVERAVIFVLHIFVFAVAVFFWHVVSARKRAFRDQSAVRLD